MDASAGAARRRVPWSRRQRKRICAWCSDGTTTIDYKNASKLRRFVNDRGKIMPRRQTGTCARHQRAMARAIKRARVMALISFVSR
jgi:small subunit ribosomal protein S18